AIEDRERNSSCAEFLGELLGVNMPVSAQLAAARSDPQLMADQLRLSLRDYLAGLAARGPLVLLLEDLQWADAASLALLGEVADDLASSPLLIVATARPELDAAGSELFLGRDFLRLEPQ